MSIKMIAVDMDGTFLDDQKEYNRERFDPDFPTNEGKGDKICCCQRGSVRSAKKLFP